MHFRLLGRSGLRVSELCLGTMTFGTEWGWGSDKETSQKVFDTFAESGGNFVDTANRYTDGTSERWLGDFVNSDRDHFVVATKYTLRDRLGDLNFVGNHRKNMMRSVEDSMRRLDTDFIDLLWVHAWDDTTPVEETLRGLDDLVRSGKVHYIGISDSPAWIASKANTMAELRGWTAYAALQVEYSLLQRTPERDLLPMAAHYGMAVTAWGALGGGALTGKYLKGDTGRINEKSARRNDRANTIAQKVIDVATELGVTPGQVALNWVRQNRQDVNVIPIVGARTPEQLQDSLGALNFQLPETALQILNEASAIELGFPHEFLQSDGVRDVIYGGLYDQLKKNKP